MNDELHDFTIWRAASRRQTRKIYIERCLTEGFGWEVRDGNSGILLRFCLTKWGARRLAHRLLTRQAEREEIK